METNWERRTELPQISRALVERALVDVFPDWTLSHYEVISGGLVNANVRVGAQANKAAQHDVVLRLFLRDDDACAKEAALLRRLHGSLPVPRVFGTTYVEIEHQGEIRIVPALFLEFVEGTRLSETLITLSPQQQARAGADAGQHLARLHQQSTKLLGMLDADLNVTQPMGRLVETWENALSALLDSPRVRRRLPRGLLQPLSQIVNHDMSQLGELEGHTVILHGDFKPTNLLVAEDGSVTSLLDWEFAWSGPPLFDLGQMLRYELPAAFRDSLCTTYVQEGGTLPPNWTRLVKLLDVLNLMQFLDRSESRPTQTRDVVALIDAFVVVIGQPGE